MKKNNIFYSFFIIFLYIFISLVFSALYSSLNLNNIVIENLVLTLNSLIILLIFTFIYRKELKIEVIDFKKNYKHYLKIVLIYWMIGFIFMTLSNSLINNFILTNVAPNEEANREIIRNYPFYSAISMSLLMPIVEEIIFRLSFKESIKNKVIFIMVSGLIFGSLHVMLSLTSAPDLYYLIPYNILGLTFSVICAKTDNICSSICAHVIHNTLTVTLLLMYL